VTATTRSSGAFAGFNHLFGDAGFDTLNGGNGFDDLCIGEVETNCEA
jgi:hypothetical protein